MWIAYHITAQRVLNDIIAKRFDPDGGKEDNGMF
jgi:hypothetical protein